MCSVVNYHIRAYWHKNVVECPLSLCKFGFAVGLNPGTWSLSHLSWINRIRYVLVLMGLALTKKLTSEGWEVGKWSPRGWGSWFGLFHKDPQSQGSCRGWLAFSFLFVSFHEMAVPSSGLSQCWSCHREGGSRDTEETQVLHAAGCGHKRASKLWVVLSK